ncbi:MAG: serine hydrolase [Saprospiraceae bacterium]|nr:serine hydrolase [Saprospiraceae bacterium]
MFLTRTKAFCQLLFLLLVSLPLACQENRAAVKWGGLEAETVDLLEAFHAAGLAVGIVENGSLTYVKGFGYRNVEKSLPVDQHTLFGIGSVTKAFTAGVLGVLREEGKLSLQDSPQTHISELRFNNEEMNNRIKIHHLLSHSSGVGQMTAESSCILFLSENRNDVIPRIRHWEPAAEVGAAFLYNNFMYTLAGVVGERITGNTWEENVRNLIFQPLGMQDSRIGYRAASTATNFAHGYSVLAEKPERVLPELVPTRSPGGDIYSSIADMSEWMGLWLNEGKSGNQQLLPARYVREATSPKQAMQTGEEDGPGSPSYGYGWMISDFHGHKRVEHAGAISGYSSNVVLFPEQQLGIIVLSNQSNSSLPNIVADLFIDKLLQIERQTAEEPIIRYSRIYPIDPVSSTTRINAGQAPTYDLTDLVGNYFHPGFGTLTISFTDGVLLAACPFTTFRLTHAEGNTFNSVFAEEIPQIMGPFLRFTFHASNRKKVDSVLVNVGEEQVAFSRERE